MCLINNIFQFYYNNLCKSSAMVLREKYLKGRKRVEWLQCSELADIYSTMKRVESKPNISEIEKLLKRDSTPIASLQPKQNTLGVIVETRKSASLEFVIINFIEQTGLSVQLFHGINNLQYVLASKIRSYVDTGQVTLYELHTNTLNASMYNDLFLSRAFWEAMICRDKIFVFQTDSWICKESDFSLNNFLPFDYIGSWWSRKRPVGLVIDGGSGGFSIRDWGKSMKCLKTFSPERWRGGEDGYFSFHMELLGGWIAKKEDCEKFSTQGYFNCKSFGAHQISLLPKSKQGRFIDYCPEAKFLLK